MAFSLALVSGFIPGFVSGVNAKPVANPDLAAVLAKLDASSVKFKSAQAEILIDNVQTEPVPDKDTQTGTVAFQRKGGQLSMALHLKTDNGKPVPKDAIYANGQFKLYEPLLKQVQIFKAGNRSDIDSFLALGFGASGKELEKNWAIVYDGLEPVAGVSTAKLELTPRDETVKKNITKVILWLDMDNGIALKQQSFDTSGNYRLATYKIQHLNGGMASDAFELKTAPGTRVINR